MSWYARPAVDVLLLALVTGLGGGAMAAAAPFGFPLDDAWIHLQIARNFSTGHGFGLNPDAPVSLSTAPLWTLLVALLHLLPWSIIASVKAVGALLLFANALCTRILARQLGLPGSWALLAGLVVVLTPRFLWASQSGMEILLYTLLASGGLVLHKRTFAGTPSLWGTGLWAAAVLARPECAILFPLAIMDRWRVEGRLSAMVSLYWKHGLLFVLMLLPWALFNLRYGSGPLPNTFYAKVGSYGLMGALADGAWLRVGAAVLLYPLEQMQELVQFSVENNVMLTVAAPLGLLALIRRGKETS